jgi:hypothetical protein
VSIALNKRERILAITTAVVLAVVLLYFLFTAWQGPRGALLAQKTNAAAELERKQNRLDLAIKASEQLAEWQERSLPANSETALSLYQNWLLKTARDAGFSGITIDAAQGRRRPGVFQALRLNLQAAASLEELTLFLHRFYQAGHLHQILALGLVPESRGSKLSLQMTVEALSLPATDRTDSLSAAASPHKLDALDAYRNSIARRNLFAAYQPPARPPAEPARVASPPPPSPPRFDPARHAYLTAIVSVDDRPQAWILARTSGEKFELFEGDAFRIGDTRGKVLRIGQREAEVEFDGQRYIVPLGENLRTQANSPE